MLFVSTVIDLISNIMNAEIVVDCENSVCIDEIDKLEAELAVCMQKCHSTKQKYHAALVENLKKDLILRNLTNQPNENRFEEFGDTFPIETIKLLRSFSSKPENDSSFVLVSVRSLYRNDLATLKNKSYSGHSKNNVKKPFTPEKLDRLKSIYEKRIEYEHDDGIHDSLDRKKKFPKHVKTALETINKVK